MLYAKIKVNCKVEMTFARKMKEKLQKICIYQKKSSTFVT